MVSERERERERDSIGPLALREILALASDRLIC
jgi:hypothetical protein